MNKVFPYWQGLLKLLVDRGDGTHAERVEAYPPKVLMTDDDGEYARMRVDVGQTGFFAGREFFSFLEFSIPTGQSICIKVVSNVDAILYDFSASIDLAAIRVSLTTGGTESGTFSTTLPSIKTNSMTSASAYASQVSMSSGGDHTGGTDIYVIRVVAGANANHSTATAASNDYPFGFPAGTYYIKIENTDGNDAAGVFKARWEERP